MRRRTLIALLAGLVLAAGTARTDAADDKSIVVASTTSTEDSGLFGYLLPIFKARTGIDVKVVAQGTGQALDTGQRGDADVVFVHAKAQEEKFVAEGFGVKRFDVMYNDFVLIGPKGGPARMRKFYHDGLKDGRDIIRALSLIFMANGALPFVSRGDRSGTHMAELALWHSAGFAPEKSKLNDDWYREIGQGMGAALNTAAAMGAYVLADRGTWISFKNKDALEIAVAGDARLFNQYGIILVNPARHPTVKRELGQAFIDWVLSKDGQDAIRSYKIDGQQLFFPNADARQLEKAG